MMTRAQLSEMAKFTRENHATVELVTQLPHGRVVIMYSLSQAPAQESLTARKLPEWAEVLYGPLGSELEFSASWNERRGARQTIQAAYTGSLA